MKARLYKFGIEGGHHHEFELAMIHGTPFLLIVDKREYYVRGSADYVGPDGEGGIIAAIAYHRVDAALVAPISTIENTNATLTD